MKISAVRIRDFVTRRWFIKIGFLLIFVHSVIQLLRFESYMIQGGTPIQRPEAVAGLLPVGHFTSFFAWIRGGGWDALLPAGLIIIIAALVVSFLFKRGFCGYVCPVGTVWELSALAGRKLLRRDQNFRLPVVLDWIGRILQLVLTVAVVGWLISVPLPEAVGFRQLPYMWVADLKILQSFTNPVYLLVILLAIVIFILMGSLWCRYLCPVGGLYSIVGMASPCKVHRNVETCIDCKKCTHACPHFIDPSATHTVNSNTCDGCMECVKACPVENCLQPKAFGRLPLKPYVWAIGVVLVWALIVGGAYAAGQWHSKIPTEAFRQVINSGLLQETTPMTPSGGGQQQSWYDTNR